MSRLRMNSEAARMESRRLVENGWADWLLDELRAKAVERFEIANPENIEALKTARALFVSAAWVETIIKDSAQVRRLPKTRAD